jgi:hypothetical protein
MGAGSAAHRRSRAKRDPERAAQHPGHEAANHLDSVNLPETIMGDQ